MPAAWIIVIVVLWVAVLALAVVVLGVLRQVSAALDRAAAHSGPIAPWQQGPRVGDLVPHFTGRDMAGKVVDDRGLRGQPALLVFLREGCGPCHRLAQEMSANDLSAISDKLIIVTNATNPGELDVPEGLRVVSESDNELSTPLAVQATPFAIALDEGGFVRAANVPNTLAELRSLAAVVSSAVADAAG